MNAIVFSLDGKKLKEISLPKVFSTEFHPNLIKRAVLAIQSARIQPKGIYPLAGRDYSAKYSARRYLPTMERIMNTEHARLPHLKNRRGLLAGKVANVPRAVHGPRAHPPHVEKITLEKINKKEKKEALHSAIAASVKIDLVSKRHVFDNKINLPIVVEEKFAELKKTKDVVLFLEKIGLYADVESAKSKKKVRAGRGKMRGRKYRHKKSLLIVTEKNSPVYKAARNLEGVEICSARNLNAELFAPGCLPGRLTVWTEKAIEFLGKN